MAKISDKDAALLTDKEARQRHEDVAAPLDAVARSLEGVLEQLKEIAGRPTDMEKLSVLFRPTDIAPLVTEISKGIADMKAMARPSRFQVIRSNGVIDAVVPIYEK